MESKDTFEEDKRIASLASDIEFYKKRAQEVVGVPPQYFGGCDPYEDSSTSKATIFKKVGNVYESILNKLRG